MDSEAPALLLATDGSISALGATLRAVELARERGAQLHAVHVATPESDLQVEFAETSLETLHARPVDGLEAARYLAEKAGVPVHTHEVRGVIVDAIVQTARRVGADTIIAGETGPRPFGGDKVGSVAEGIRRHSDDVPVVLVPGRTEEVVPVLAEILRSDPAAVPGGGSADSDIDWTLAVHDRSFRDLIATKVRFLVPVVVFYLGFYLGITLLAGFAPEFMARRVIGAVNVGYLLIIAIYVVVWILALVYVRVANTTFDPKAASVAADATGRAAKR
jgi:uncharacterized membrane protein (DUF485 family)/nucleotide-binding universal stress UspA family protein